MSTEPPRPDVSPSASLDQMRRERREKRRRQIRRRRVVALVALVLVVLVIPPLVSYTVYMSRPSSVTWSVRTVEWVRDNHGAWLVNRIENVYYSMTAPKQGGPGLTTLPSVAADPASPSTAARHRAVYADRPQAVVPAITPVLHNEGVWKPAGMLVNGRPALWVTVFRNERAYPRLLTYAAVIDHSLTQLALYPGRTEPSQGSPRGMMMVPPGQRQRLLATFNSGFKYKDGHGGFAVNGNVYEPLGRGMGTLVGYTDGHVDIVRWPGGKPGADIVLARQNLPMIVDNGKPNPNLSTSGAMWGWTLGNAVRVWRSGVGINARGDLVYVAAPSQTVMSLASALIRAGAVRALELDINVYWPTFNYYRRAGARSPVKFLTNSQNPGITRYLVPDDRDFFAVYARNANADFSVPFK